jgi:hypothetical protein
MNLRLDPRAVRLRLSPSEAETALSAGSLLESCVVPGGALSFRLDVVQDTPGAAVRMEEGRMVLSVSPEGLRAALARAPAKDAGVYAELDGLSVAVEIDAKRKLQLVRDK